MSTDHGFKLLAIRPLKGCDEKVRRVLIEGKLYQFYNEYNFEWNETEIIGVKYEPTIPLDLYYVDRPNSDKKLPIHISAVVGKNGTGKSSIVELLYAACFNMALQWHILPDKDDDGRRLEILSNLNVEIFYTLNDSFYKLKLSVSETASFILKDDMFTNSQISYEDKEFLVKEFFYTIAINYSQHALNAYHLGHWVNQLFHKNDGYQTPIVLNPYRKYGNIKINTEEQLTYSRILSILLTRQNEKNLNINTYYRELVPGKIAEKVRLTLNAGKVKFKPDEKGIKDVLVENKGYILDAVFSVFNIRPALPYNTNNAFIRVAYQYILKKSYTISSRYAPYQNDKLVFIDEVDTKDKKNVRYKFDNTAFIRFIEELKRDSSHITFKFRQALNFVNSFEEYEQFVGSKKGKKDLNHLADFLYKIKREDELINYLPPSFFNYYIYFGREGELKQLSSGEKQKIFSSASYIYHIVNINSVREKGSYRRYEYINIVFDEIELYYHPELQKSFVNDFIGNISRLNVPYISGVNCLFITHSPFILSDIPNANVLFLEEMAKPVDPKDTHFIETFGANIHDLLKNSFFLENGSMGEFAKEKISETIDYLNLEIHKKRRPNANDSNNKPKNTELKEWEDEKERLMRKVGDKNNREYHESVINMIGEPILRKKLQSMYREVASESELENINREIENLEKKRELLKLKRDA